MAARWHALVLAAGRGPDDPMAKAHGVANKAVIAVAGRPMLARVVGTLREAGPVASIMVAIESRGIATAVLGDDIETIAAAASAPASVMAAIASGRLAYPVLVTTADHPLLTPDMVRHFCQSTEQSGADMTVGLATAETILAAYPDAIRTFFNLGGTRVSGCNLFALRNDKGLRLLARWQYLEAVRKKPWRLVAAFGIAPLLRFVTGTLTPARAFDAVSRRLGLTLAPVMMPQAEAAIDVDKPADKELAERILARREGPATAP
jgi:GTP:adenosylcobinamide-phosphate guanylyltransferase